MRIISLLLIGLLFLSPNINAQLPPSPDFAHQPCFWKKNDSSLIKLKKEAMGFAGKIGAAYYSFEGTQSTVRVSAATIYPIIMKFSEQLDPASILTFYKLTVKKKNREAVMAVSQGMSVSSTSKNAVAYDLKKLASDLVEIVPSATLDAGEYALVVGGTAYTFGID